jgi:phosphoribosylformylglycinamidine (FGAM) synthase-like amidotransferase family enzyme
MKSAVVLLPGLNRDRDMIAALTKISGHAAHRLADRHRRSPTST